MGETPVVVNVRSLDLDEGMLRAVAKTWSEAFPTPPGRDRYAEALERRSLKATEAFANEWIHAIFEEDECLAACRTFHRTVKVNGEPRKVLALAHVATSPKARGKGYGSTVVRSAFDTRLETAIPESLFCTGIPEFYHKKVGASTVTPTTITYPPNAKPFKDAAILRYAIPGAPTFPSDAILDAGGDGW